MPPDQASRTLGVGDSDILLASGHFSPLYVCSEHKPRRSIELWAGEEAVRTFWSTSPSRMS